MKNRKSIILVIGISIFVGLLHLLIGPPYSGFQERFINGYLIDIFLPLNMYLLLQIALRKKLSVIKSRIIGAITVFLFGITVELLQFKAIQIFGNTYDFIDIIMYSLGIGLGLLIDLIIIDRFEKTVI